MDRRRKYNTDEERRLARRDSERRYRERKPERRRAQVAISNPRYYQKSFRAKCLKAKYGITVAQYYQMVLLQGGVCAMCFSPPSRRWFDVDHDHLTNRVRGLLCMDCNTRKVGSNDLDSARRMVAYLASSFDGREV